MSWKWLVGKRATVPGRGDGEIVDIEEITVARANATRVIVEVDGVEINVDADRVEVE